MAQAPHGNTQDKLVSGCIQPEPRAFFTESPKLLGPFEQHAPSRLFANCTISSRTCEVLRRVTQESKCRTSMTCGKQQSGESPEIFPANHTSGILQRPTTSLSELGGSADLQVHGPQSHKLPGRQRQGYPNRRVCRSNIKGYKLFVPCGQPGRPGRGVVGQ